jgi:HD-GYP domain-containing protein (c-di-GMP phosphodiesterase class II)
LTRLSYILVAAALATTAAPAFAGNDQPPGQVKKDEVTSQAPAPAAAPVATTTPAHAPQVNKTVPVNKGTVKNAIPKKTATAKTTGSATTPAQTSSRLAARHRTRTTSGHGTGRRRQRSTTHPTSRTRSGASRSASSSPEPDRITTAAAGRAHHAALPYARAADPQTTTVDPAKARPESSAPLAEISRAADRVVEVIPGAIILALAGLIGLVLVLIVRSWAMERRRAKALANSYGVTVEALATAIEAKDHCTGGHIERVRNLGLLLAGQIVPRETKDPQMAYGFLLHDIGKLAVPDEILRAPGRLNAEQWALMRRHPDEGVRMLSHVPFLDKALDVVRFHHERWDGGGYPAGLSGEEIPLWARIFSVVDALDAMTAARPYRDGRSYQAALAEIRRNAGTQFDPDVVSALERINPAEIEPLLEPTQIVDPRLAPVHDLRALIPA